MCFRKVDEMHKKLSHLRTKIQSTHFLDIIYYLCTVLSLHITMSSQRLIGIILLAILLYNPAVLAQTVETDSRQLTDSIATKKSGNNIIKSVIDYFGKQNKEIPHHGLHIGFLGGPHYSSETKLGIGIMAAGNYYNSPDTDTITKISNIAIYTDITTGGFYKFGIRGTNFSRGNKWRSSYHASFYSFLRHFWGIGYESGIDYDNYTKFKELNIQLDANLLYNFGHNIYAGATAQFTHFKANKVNDNQIYRWGGQALSTYSTNIGLELMYDSRDNITAPQRGLMAHVVQRFSPRFLGNHYAYSNTEIEASAYFNTWKDAIVATKIHSMFCYGNVPWGMMPTCGGSEIMRGYYEGRFRDKNEVDLTVELRQHVWRRNGIVAWGGIGKIFPKFSAFNMKNLLPCYGIGYRWEFKKYTNVRLDFGVGRNETAFIFSINEAF